VITCVATGIPAPDVTITPNPYVSSDDYVIRKYDVNEFTRKTVMTVYPYEAIREFLLGDPLWCTARAHETHDPHAEEDALYIPMDANLLFNY
jgi:hypothetical protein